MSLEKIDSISVIGAGSWGSAVAHLLATQGYPVMLWAFEPEVVASINHKHENSLFHPGIRLAKAIRCSASLPEVLQASALLVIAIPTQFIRSTLTAVAALLDPNKTIVSVSKGIENDSLMTVSQLLCDIQPKLRPEQIGVLSGPSFSREVLDGLPTAVSLACADGKRGKALQRIFHCNNFRTYLSHDVIGVEIGGAIKNVIAIGVGIADGLNFGFNARAGLITRSLAEITRLATKMGAEAKTLSGLAGMGDLLLTCTGDLSRNRRLGLAIGRGKSLATLLKESHMIVEGVETARSAHLLAKKHAVEMPIVEQVYQVLHEDKPPLQAVKELLARDPKFEFA